MLSHQRLKEFVQSISFFNNFLKTEMIKKTYFSHSEELEIKLNLVKINT